jgi:predicted porin
MAFHYDLGFVKPMLYYARAKVGTNASLTNKTITIGLLAPIGGGTVKAAYGRLTPDTATVSALNSVGAGNGRQQKFGLGYDYPLSKRTNLYADVSSARKAGTVANAGVTSFSNNTAYALGVKHTF